MGPSSLQQGAQAWRPGSTCESGAQNAALMAHVVASEQHIVVWHSVPYLIRTPHTQRQAAARPDFIRGWAFTVVFSALGCNSLSEAPHSAEEHACKAPVENGCQATARQVTSAPTSSGHLHIRAHASPASDGSQSSGMHQGRQPYPSSGRAWLCP